MASVDIMFGGSTIRFWCLSRIVFISGGLMKLDEWTDEQADFLTDSGGNGAVNTTYNAHVDTTPC